MFKTFILAFVVFALAVFAGITSTSALAEEHETPTPTPTLTPEVQGTTTDLPAAAPQTGFGS